TTRFPIVSLLTQLFEISYHILPQNAIRQNAPIFPDFFKKGAVLFCSTASKDGQYGMKRFSLHHSSMPAKHWPASISPRPVARIASFPLGPEAMRCTRELKIRSATAQ